MDDEKSPTVAKGLYFLLSTKFREWFSGKKEEKSLSFVKSAKFEDKFPSPGDLPETRKKKWELLTEVWKPSKDIWAFIYGPAVVTSFAALCQMSILVAVRRQFKVNSHRLISIPPTIAMAGAGSFVFLYYQNSRLVKGEINCVECHLIKTGSYAVLFSTLLPSINSIIVTTYAAVHTPGIPLPLDFFERFSATKEGLKIVLRTSFSRPIISRVIIAALFNAGVSVGLVYLSMYQYRNVHQSLLAEYKKELVI